MYEYIWGDYMFLLDIICIIWAKESHFEIFLRGLFHFQCWKSEFDNFEKKKQTNKNKIKKKKAKTTAKL